ncbi:membrane protein [Streptomyces noursei ATCC 11455]|uniref:hypothetical protein n=1 Tax=Streptomyces noursei TaxID=1971 RepID=UPI00081C7238|nr:membrane protein [Streptomyces noursei ATCC 11455]
MSIGLLSAVGVALYAATVSVLAFTSAFARREELRREARSTLSILVASRDAERALPAVPDDQ